MKTVLVSVRTLLRSLPGCSKGLFWASEKKRVAFSQKTERAM